MKENLHPTPYPYHSCPSFDVCSAPKCPLDPSYSERSPRLKNEEKCRATKRVRIRIAKSYPDLLPFKGLTPKEFSGYKLAGVLDRL